MRYLSLIPKSLLNNRLRTALTLTGVAVAAFVFCFFESMQHTMTAVVAKAGENNNLVVMKINTW